MKISFSFGKESYSLEFDENSEILGFANFKVKTFDLRNFLEIIDFEAKK